MTKDRQVTASSGHPALDAFLNARPLSVVLELLHNARRAGSNRILLSFHPQSDRGELTVRIADDGTGIADPAHLLTYGRAFWPRHVTKTEQPEGTGFAALASRHCSATHVHTCTQTRAWSAHISPRQLLGQQPVDITVPDNDTKPIPGTTLKITFRPGSIDHCPQPKHLANEIYNDLCKISPWFPTSIVHHGSHPSMDFLPTGPLPTKDPWDDPHAYGTIVHADDADFTILQDTLLYSYRTGRNQVNLFGYRVTCPIASLTDRSGKNIVAHARIRNARGLRLSKPDRDSIQPGPALERLREQAERAIIQFIEESPDTWPSFQTFSRAAELGIVMKEPPEEVPKWYPLSALDDSIPSEPFIPITPGSILCPPTSPAIEQCIHNACDSINSITGNAPTFHRPSPHLQGFSWHDGIPSIRMDLAKPRFLARKSSQDPLEPISHKHLKPTRATADFLRLDIPLLTGDKHTGMLRLPLTVALLHEIDAENPTQPPDPDHTSIYVTRSSYVCIHEFSQTLLLALFQEDSECDEQDFLQWAWETGIFLTRDPDRRLRLLLEKLIKRELSEAFQTPVSAVLRIEPIDKPDKSATNTIRIEFPDAILTPPRLES